MIVSNTHCFHFSPSKLSYITSNLKIKNSQIVYANGKDHLVYETNEALTLKLALDNSNKPITVQEKQYGKQFITVETIDIKFPIGDSVTRELVSHTYFSSQDQSTLDKYFNSIVQTLRSR
jgi:hypothetical protein